MERRGPKARLVVSVFSLWKLACVAAMKELRGESTTALLMAESNTTKGKPPSMAPYTFSPAAHLPYLIEDATIQRKINTEFSQNWVKGPCGNVQSKS